MSLRFYNTIKREKEDFLPLDENLVKIYSCGPTVYSRQHIGNLRAAIFIDVLKRTLRFAGYRVEDVVNITDVGHLVSDEDEGEDKMLKASKKENKDPYEIAREYERLYIDDIKNLNVILPSNMPRATEHVGEQIEIIRELEKKGYTYQTSDGIYFDTSKYEDYGILSRQRVDEKKAGARVEVVDEKKNPQDFALWKFLTGDNKNHIMKWDSPWGEGFPGWHIECSAMSKKYLGDNFDIHTGGVDHIHVHHENEIAQNSCSGCVKKVNYWIHNEFVKVDGEKMSKSLGNVYNLQDIINKGFSPLAFRELCLRSHYRKQLNFTFEALESAQRSVEKYNEFYRTISEMVVVERSDELSDIVDSYMRDFREMIFDDLNVPGAMACVYELQSRVNKLGGLNKDEKSKVLWFIEETDKVLGLLVREDDIPEEIINLAEKRKEMRNKKDFKTADELRDEIFNKGWEIKDSREVESGYLLKKRRD